MTEKLGTVQPPLLLDVQAPSGVEKIHPWTRQAVKKPPATVSTESLFAHAIVTINSACPAIWLRWRTIDFIKNERYIHF